MDCRRLKLKMVSIVNFQLSIGILIFTFYLLLVPALFAQDVHISGENTATYIYRTAEDSLKHYFDDELTFRVNYKNFTLGMTFLAGLPKYNKTEPIEELNPRDVYTQWEERYVEVTFDDLFLKAGTIEEAFGAGIALRLWNDKDLDQDRRAEGAQIQYFHNGLKLSGVYGALRADVPDQNIYKDDLVIGFDGEYKITNSGLNITIGGSGVQYKNKSGIYLDRYADTNIFAGRASMMSDVFDLKAEIASLNPDHNNTMGERGSAMYGIGNLYVGKFTFTAGYKQYNKYNYALADLPTLNHYDELLTNMEYVDTDYEEGLMGEVKFIPNSDNELLVNYAESWDRDYNVRHANLFTELKRHFSSFSMTLDYEHLERLVKDAQVWNKELTPSVSFDFHKLSIPLTTKLKWSYNEEEHYTDKKTYNKPYLQIDAKVHKNLSISVFGETQFKNADDISKQTPYLGTEIVSSISNHTDVKLFVGKESGGKVCRNGTCQMQAPFEGLRLSLTTRF